MVDCQLAKTPSGLVQCGDDIGAVPVLWCRFFRLNLFVHVLTPLQDFFACEF